MVDAGENHRRTIGVTLGMLDAMLCDFERWATEEGIRSVLYERTNRLTPAQVRRIRAEAAEMRGLMVQMRDDLGLETRSDDVAAMIWSQAVSYWETLIETESEHLRAYGPVSPGLSAYLDPKIQALNERLQQIGQAAKTRRDDTET